ncbi:MAG: septum formation initiator family protein [Alphaproteobacteria bacterium]|jgi:Septum formation initiator|nr:septum formation initiator family protein [Alphaproteobacteria bacterium]MBU0793686.1 septum formation initiator family protein [Alphaproteobacteria bacterium]MBU0877344.1 septum formation initiator family protein [Alphaproteobacteria bacterium]MBU1770480.1 septum formation initiator family protein [Alphaproteobacteria bacterium]
MAHLAKLRFLLGSAFTPAIAIFLLLLFIGYAIIGPNGILAWSDYSRQLKQRQTELAALQKQKAQLENRVKLLDPRHADPDMVDELVRKQLGVTHPDEVVVPLK